MPDWSGLGVDPTDLHSDPGRDDYPSKHPGSKKGGGGSAMERAREKSRKAREEGERVRPVKLPAWRVNEGDEVILPGGAKGVVREVVPRYENGFPVDDGKIALDLGDGEPVLVGIDDYVEIMMTGYELQAEQSGARARRARWSGLGMNPVDLHSDPSRQDYPTKHPGGARGGSRSAGCSRSRPPDSFLEVDAKGQRVRKAPQE